MRRNAVFIAKALIANTGRLLQGLLLCSNTACFARTGAPSPHWTASEPHARGAGRRETMGRALREENPARESVFLFAPILGA
jgi:hypothetical protein